MRSLASGRALRLLVLVALLVPSTGCVTGLLYTHVTTPLDVDFNRTPVQEETGRDSVKTFQFYVQITWGSDGLGEVAKKHGFKRIYYADLETLSILGIWTQQYAHVYGER